MCLPFFDAYKYTACVYLFQNLHTYFMVNQPPPLKVLPPENKALPGITSLLSIGFPQ